MKKQINYDETLYRYITYYRAGINGDKVAQQKAEILRLCLPEEYKLALFRMRANIRNCTENQYCKTLTKFAERASIGNKIPLESLLEATRIEYR